MYNRPTCGLSAQLGSGQQAEKRHKYVGNPVIAPESAVSHESTVVPVKGMAIPPRAVDEVAMRKAVLSQAVLRKS